MKVQEKYFKLKSLIILCNLNISSEYDLQNNIYIRLIQINRMIVKIYIQNSHIYLYKLG